MSSTNVEPKKQRKKRRKTEKRKASQSPDIDLHNTQPLTSGKSNILCADSVNSTYQNNVFDIFSQNSVDFVSSVMNPSPVLNFAQQIPYGFQAQPQTPNVFSTPINTQTQQPNLPSNPPAWAAGLIEDVKTIKSALPKLDQIEQTVNKIKTKLSAIETRVTHLETKVTDIETSCNFISNQHDQQNKEMKLAKGKIEDLNKSCQNLEKSLKDFEIKCEKSNEDIMDLKSRSMRENLVFYGIQEESSGVENCELLVKNLIETHLELSPTNMIFDRAHRLGRRNATKARPIVVKFHSYNDREKVRTKSIEKPIKEKLRGLNLGIGVQQPQEYRDARKAFRPIIEREQQLGNRVSTVGNKLYVNNVCTRKFIDGQVCEVQNGK